MRFTLGFTTCFALVAWFCLVGPLDRLRKLGIDLESTSQVDQFGGQLLNSPAVGEESQHTPANEAPSVRERAIPPASIDASSVVSRSLSPVETPSLEGMPPEDASRLLQAENLKLMVETANELKERAAELALRERELAKREVAAAELASATKAKATPTSRKKAKQKQEVEDQSASDPRSEQSVMARAPAPPVYYRCCGCCKCSCHKRTYVFARRVGPLGRLLRRY